MTKRRVQGGEATSERRRRDGVYQKSYKRAFLPLIYLLPRARVSRTSHAWRVHAARDKSKVGGFAAPHDFSHTTRANISHERAEQIRARIVCTPAEKCVAGVGGACAPTKARIFASLLLWGIDRFAQANAVGVAETGAEGGAVYRDG
ncbi:MAG TPA: hypothetical protein DD628_03455 [Clostridiales bacterium]|nr:hypothetical protein [Candidatus Apopatosoma intestinale]